MSKQEELLAILSQKNIIKSEDAGNIVKEAQSAGKKVEDILISRQIINPEDLAQVKSEVYRLPYENLIERNIGEGIVSTISSEVAENYKVICFDKEDNRIKVGILDPDNFKAVEAIDFLAKGSGLKVEYYLISEKSFKAAFKQYKSLAKELSSALETRAEEEVVVAEEKDERELNEITKSAPVAKIVSVVIRHAVEGGASDIHVEPSRKESRVRYRIDGILHTSLVLPRSVHDALVARIKVMANLKLDETRIPQDGRIRLVFNDKDYDFRVSILPLIGAEKVVMRILEASKQPPTLEELGYEGIQLEVIQKNLKKTEGLLLATGPTGSGKSTTLFSILHIINKEEINIVTLEDPVEYQVKGISQSQIKPDIGYTFASGLRSFMRQDPDVIMVGEIRDEETAELAIHSALTGHFVISTLHTTSAAGAIPRLVDMNVEAFLLGSTLHTVIAQRLARKICSHCKEEVKIPDEQLKKIKAEIEDVGIDYIKSMVKDFNPEKMVFYKGKGCPRCGNSGYSGRVALSEVLDINDQLKEFIIEGKKHLSIKEIKSSQKFVKIKQDGFIKVLQGKTTMQEVLRVIEN
ncbi:hypothetical protein DRH27_02725 [Candidatus Falkowbacteria bacterium]|nr:MAG: hypothetical protein DRH27_02725 [Candidatus Falkowbacteria bacterium]